jgi:aminoglycoside phosphotransferase (APT) family kinase protein
VGVRRPSGRVRRLVRALTLGDPAGALGRDVASEGGRTQTHCYSGDLTRASEWRAMDRSEPWWRQWGDLVRAPAMSFVGWRNPRARSLFDRVFDSAQERCRDAWGGGGRLSVTQQFFSNPEGATFVCSYGARALILRVPLNDRTADRFKRNYEALGAMSAAGFGTSIAHPLFAGRVGDRPYFAESVVGGEPLRTHVHKGNARAVDEAIEWITQVHAATAHRQPLKGAWLTDRVSAPVRKAFRFLGRTDLEPVCHRMHLFLEGQLAHRPLPLVRTHGDFSIDNVRVSADGRTVTGVFDWDLSTGAGLPFLDLCYLLASAEAHRRREPLGHSLARLVAQLEAGDRVSAAVSRYRMTLGLPEHLMFPLGLLTWVYHVAFRIENLEPYRWPHLMADVVDPILPILERRLEAARRSA